MIASVLLNFSQEYQARHTVEKLRQHVAATASTIRTGTEQDIAVIDLVVESLATQTLVIFVIRTAGSPFRSRPSRQLVATVLAVVAIGAVMPFPIVGRWFYPHAIALSGRHRRHDRDVPDVGPVGENMVLPSA